MWYIQTREYYSAFLKRKEILRQATRWMNLEDIKQCEISPSQKDNYCIISLILSIKSRFTEPEIRMVMFPETGRRQKMGS